MAAGRVVDVVVVSALAVEHRAVSRALGAADPHSRVEGDAVLATVDGCRVAAVPLAAMGNSGAAAGSQLAIDRWRPGAVLPTGIAAGVSDRVRRGDVLVAEAVVGYEPGKHDGTGLHRRPDVHRAGFALLAAARAVAEEPGAPAHVGTVLSGEKVLADAEVFAQLRRDWPATVGVEMEGLGVATAAYRNGIAFLLAKGVSDFADASKDDSWRERAAEAAAGFVVAVLRRLTTAAEDDPQAPAREQPQRFVLARSQAPPAVVTAVAGPIYRTRGADMWVNSENTNMEMSRTSDFTISAVIRYWGARRDRTGKVVDDVIADELGRRVRRAVPVAPATVITTGSGELARSHGVRRILHVASVVGEPGSGFHQVRNVTACVDNVLAEADRLARADRELRVVLLPLLGVGAGGGPLAPTVATMVDAVVDFLAAGADSPLSEVRLLGYSTAEWRVLTATLAGHPLLSPAAGS